MPKSKGTTTKNNNSKKLKSKKIPRKLPPGIKMAQKLKKRPFSATEPRELKPAHNPSNEFKGSIFGAHSITGVPKISEKNNTTPFVAVFPSNVVKKTGKNSLNKDPNSYGPLTPAPKPATTTMNAMLSGGRRPGTFTSPPVTANQDLLAALHTSSKAKKNLQNKKPKSTCSVGGSKNKDNKSNTIEGKQPRAKTAAADFISFTANHYASPFAKSAVKTVTNAKIRATDRAINRQLMETKVVLAPRFGIDSNEPSNLTVVPEDDEGSITSLIQKLTKSSIATANTNTDMKDMDIKSSEGDVLRNTNICFPPEKARWVQMALDNLGKSWAASGILPPHLVDFPEFKTKIGDLYDMAVEKKLNEMRNNIEQSQDKPRPPPSLKGTVAARASDKSKTSPTKIDLPQEIQKKMSDILLQLLLKKLLPSKPPETQDASTNTESGPHDATTEGSLSGRLDTAGRREIKACYVLEGQLIPIESSSNLKSSFAPLSDSRRRRCPTEIGYFRRAADLRGFEPEEIKLQFAKTRIFVEGRQAQKDERNARLVREIVMLPKGLDIDDVKVLRGKKGLIIFEEVSKPV